MDISEMASLIVNELQSTATEILKARGIKGWGALIPAVIMRVEQIREAGAPLAGPDKKAVAATVLNRLVNLPIVPEFVEQKLFEAAVDWFVEFFNRQFGKGWGGLKLPF